MSTPGIPTSAQRIEINKEAGEQGIQDASRLVESEGQETPAINVEDIQRMQLLIGDLSRRLQNAQHTIDAQKRIAKNASQRSEKYRQAMGEMSNMLRLETAKNATNQRKKIREEEALRYEADKKRAGKMQEDLRMALIDHGISGLSFEPSKIGKMRRKLEQLELQQESQKLLLQHLGLLEAMTEQLATAAQQGALEECARLLRKGAGVNEVDSAGYLPLHYACSKGHADVAQLLLEFGADPSSYLSGYSPLELAARFGYADVIKVLIQFGANTEDKGLAGATALVSATEGGHLKCVHDLIGYGADLNGKDLNEETPLHVASKLEDPVAIIRLLLKSGADPNVINRQGYTPLRVALARANTLAIEALGGRNSVVDLDGLEVGGVYPHRERDRDLAADAGAKTGLHEREHRLSTGVDTASVASSITTGTRGTARMRRK